MAVYIGDLKLEKIQDIKIIEERKVVKHQPLSNSGQLLQDIGRKRAKINIEGVECGKDAKKNLSTLLQIIHEGKPVNFTWEISNISHVRQVIINKLEIHQEKGYKNFYKYSLYLEEWKSISKEDSNTTEKVNKEQEKEAQQNYY